MIQRDLALVATKFVARLRQFTRAPRAGEVDAGIRAELARLGPQTRQLVALELTPEEIARWIA